MKKDWKLAKEEENNPNKHNLFIYESLIEYMKYIFNLIIILLLAQIFFVPCFGENQTDTQNNTINQSADLSLDVSLDDLKIVCENQTILVTLYLLPH